MEKSNASHSAASKIARMKESLELQFGHSDDLALYPLRVAGQEGLLCFLTTMTRSTSMMDNVVKPLVIQDLSGISREEDDLMTHIRKHVLAGLTTQLTDRSEGLAQKLGLGFAAIVLEGEPNLLLIDVKDLEVRAVSEPTTQNVVRGPKEGFTESATTNMSLIRRRIINDKLRFEKYELGEQTRTEVYLTYVEGEADERMLDAVRQRLNACSLVSLFDSGSLESLLSPEGIQLFPTVYNSERPDAICSLLLDQRIGVIVSGSPFVLITPALLHDFFQSPEDRYQWFVLSHFVRTIRYIAFFFSICMPALYVAITSYHQELIPTMLLTSIAAQREGIPFPAVIEIFLMELSFELLREASTRMPRIVGPSIAIAGALVLGEAAVQAGIVSNINVIVVSLAAISSYVAPIYSFASNIRLSRYALIVFGACLGLYGVIAGCAFLMIHLSRIETYGIPYVFSRYQRARNKTTC